MRISEVITPAAQLIQWAKENAIPGVKLDLEPYDKPDEVFIAWIYRTNSMSNPGDGARMLTGLCQEADRLRVTLWLVVEVYGERDGGALIPYYENLGFEYINDEDDTVLLDDGDMYEAQMKRVPQ